MTKAATSEANPLRHRCYMTSGRFGFISYIDFSDIIVLGAVFYFSTMLSAKLFVSPAPKLLLCLVMLLAAWFINFGVKRLLMPYPGVVEHFVNWWFSGVDSLDPEVDERPVPLLVTRDMQVGHAIGRAAGLVRTQRPKPGSTRRERRVLKEAKKVR